MSAKKKSKGKKSRAKALREDLKATAQRVWLAGLGALAVAEEEGSRVFKSLVDKGEDFEKRSRPRVQQLRQAAAEAADAAKDRAEKVAESVGETAGKVGDVIDEKLTSALHRFGVPTKREIDELNATVAALHAKLEDVKGGRKPAKRKPAKRKAAKKSARKPAKKAVRKPAKKTARKPAKRKPAKKAARKPAKKAASKRASKKTMG